MKTFFMSLLHIIRHFLSSNRQIFYNVRTKSLNLTPL
jgi:hypothetical protein